MLVLPEIADALAAGRAVVALESTIISHGLPRPDNLRVAREIESAVRAAGAVPATIAVVAGQVRVGLDDDALARVADGDDVVKASLRDLAVVIAQGRDAATTVASTAHLAARAGIPVFATGGLGGVHRNSRESWDESADLTTLSRTPILVVCAGVKSILDVPATIERLETLNVGVLGYRTDRFPGFYRADSGYPSPWRVDSATEVADVLVAARSLGTDGFGTLLVNPVSAQAELDAELHDRVLADGLLALSRHGISGKDVTPFLLEHFHRETDGASLATNVALVLANARLGAEVALELSRRGPVRPVTVICLGDVMVDVVALLPGELEPGSDLPAPIRVLAGGAAANTACWLACAGVEVVMSGRVGADPFGAWMSADLASHGVVDALARDPERPTGTCIVLVSPDGERTMVPDAAANAAMTPADLPTALFQPGHHLHLSGYTLLGPARSTAEHALVMAREVGMTVSVDAASAAPLRGAPDFLDLLGSGLTLFANRDEAVVLTGLDDPVGAVVALAARVGTAVVKLGRSGALWSDGSAPRHEPGRPDVTVADTTGAGDAFAAGYLAAMVGPGDTRTRSPRAALGRGHELAARACEVIGGRPPR